jgi:hypothetical protein
MSLVGLGRFDGATLIGTDTTAPYSVTLANVALAFLGKVSVNLNYTASAESVQSSVRQTGLK